VELAHPPDAVLYLETPPSVAMTRVQARGEAAQIFDNNEMAQRLSAGYRDGKLRGLYVGDRQDRFITVNADRSPEEVFADALAALQRLLPDYF
jgi:thymidylate kinase